MFFGENISRTNLNATKAQRVLHWSVFVIATLRWSDFQYQDIRLKGRKTFKRPMSPDLDAYSFKLISKNFLTQK